MSSLINRIFIPDLITKRLAKNTWLLFLGGGIGTLFNTFQAVLAARILGSTQYGYFALVVASVGLIMQFVDFRTWEVLISLLPRALREEEGYHPRDIVLTLLMIDLTAGCVIILIGVLAGGLLAEIFTHNGELVPLIRLYVWIAPGMLITNGVITGLLRTFDKFSWISFKSIIVGIMQFLIVSALLLLGRGLRGLIIGLLIGQYLDLFIGSFMARRGWKAQVPPANGSLSFSFSFFRTLRSQGNYIGNLWLSSIIKGLQNRADVLLLGIFATPEAVGKYRLSLDLVGNLSRLGSPVQASILPAISELISINASKKIRRMIQQVSAFLGLVFAPIFLIVLFLGEPIIDIILGTEFAGTGTMLTILTFGISVNAVLIWARPLLVAQLRVRRANIIAIIGAISEMIMILALVPRWQEIGAAVALSGMYLTNAVLSARAGYKRLREFA
jgi:O-antigen/teichoic acid export membrane protein